MKSSYNDISFVDDFFFYQGYPNIATLIEVVFGLQEKLCWKINLVTFHESI